MSTEVKLPELGDGIDSGDVLEVLVREGDTIRKDQGIVELETDKATVEVPSSLAGKVTRVHVQVGQTVPVGATLITVEPAAVEPAATGARPATHSSRPSLPTPPVSTTAAPNQASPPPPSTTTPSTTRPSTPSAPAPAPRPAASAPDRPIMPEPGPVGSATAGSGTDSPVGFSPTTTSAGDHSAGPVAAGPAVRRFAREVGVHLREIPGSGSGGRITREDVLGAVRQVNLAASQTKGKEAPQTDSWGVIRTEKLTKIRKTIASKMHESWSTVPRVTNFDDADVTELERLRQAGKADYAQKGIKLTAMPFVLKAVAMALGDHPTINASLDRENDQIVYKEYVNIGVAVDTDRGLIVPSLRAADRLSIPEIARELARLADTVRDGRFSVEDLRGSTFTISNLGAIGGTYSTPMVNTPEVAILLVGKSRQLPVVVDGQVAVRLMMPLSLSYDHRLVDGAAAARFLNDVIGYLEAPSRLLLALD